MRLIDANMLIKAVREPSIYDINVPDVIALVDEQPTVDATPVRLGKWLVTDAYPHRVYCSLCYKTNVPNEEVLFEKNEYPHYCMWCGAKMV